MHNEQYEYGNIYIYIYKYALSKNGTQSCPSLRGNEGFLILYPNVGRKQQQDRHINNLIRFCIPTEMFIKAYNTYIELI